MASCHRFSPARLLSGTSALRVFAVTLVALALLAGGPLQAAGAAPVLADVTIVTPTVAGQTFAQGYQRLASVPLPAGMKGPSEFLTEAGAFDPRADVLDLSVADAVRLTRDLPAFAGGHRTVLATPDQAVVIDVVKTATSATLRMHLLPTPAGRGQRDIDFVRVDAVTTTSGYDATVTAPDGARQSYSVAGPTDQACATGCENTYAVLGIAIGVACLFVTGGAGSVACFAAGAGASAAASFTCNSSCVIKQGGTLSAKVTCYAAYSCDVRGQAYSARNPEAPSTTSARSIVDPSMLITWRDLEGYEIYTFHTMQISRRSAYDPQTGALVMQSADLSAIAYDNDSRCSRVLNHTTVAAFVSIGLKRGSSYTTVIYSTDPAPKRTTPLPTELRCI